MYFFLTRYKNLSIKSKQMSQKYIIADDWKASEVEFLLNSIANGDTYEMVSRQLNKDVSYLKETLISIICQKIKRKEGIEAYYCNEFNISSNEIRQYMETFM
jgi:hypothetical protein